MIWHNNCAHLAGIVVEGVKQRDDGLLVGGSNIKPIEVGIGRDDLHELADILDFEVDIERVYILGDKLAVEEVARERVDERIANEPIQALVTVWRFQIVLSLIAGDLINFCKNSHKTCNYH